MAVEFKGGSKKYRFIGINRACQLISKTNIFVDLAINNEERMT